MQKDETVIQNKIALAVFNIATYIGIIAILIESKSSQIIGIVTYIGTVPISLYFLYLLLLPKRYRAKNKKMFAIEEHFEVPEEIIDKLFDTASLLYPFYIQMWAIIHLAIFINDFIVDKYIPDPSFLLRGSIMILTTIISYLLINLIMRRGLSMKYIK